MQRRPYPTPLIWTAVVLCTLVSRRAIADESGRTSLPLTPTITLVLASVEQAREVLAANDGFSDRLSHFDLQCRLQTTGVPDKEAWRRAVREEARAWTPELSATVKAAVNRLAPKLVDLQLDGPAEILLVTTSGREEANAAYTRGNAIMLPPARLTGPPESLDRLLTHELFHVLSRHDPDRRRDLYRIIGFAVGPMLELPAEWERRRMTNPDAPNLDCYLTLPLDGAERTVAPVIYANPPEFNPQVGTSLFKYLTFRLMEVDVQAGRATPRLVNGQPVLLDPANMMAYHERIGRNTKYIIHPEEIMAENFVHLIHRTPGLPNPEIVQRLGERLRQPTQEKP